MGSGQLLIWKPISGLCCSRPSRGPRLLGKQRPLLFIYTPIPWAFYHWTLVSTPVCSPSSSERAKLKQCCREFSWQWEKLMTMIRRVRNNCILSFGLCNFSFGLMARLHYACNDKGLNPFTPKSDQFQISPAASPEILHHVTQCEELGFS